MKRLLLILLSLALLLACVPTPEEEFVVNKADGRAEQKLNEVQASDAPRTGQFFPDRWEEEETLLNNVIRMGVNAEITQKADGRYPVFRTRYTEMTKDEAARMLSAILPKPVSSCERVQTKAYWTEELKKYLEYVEERRQWLVDGIPDLGDGDYSIPDDREVEQTIEQYRERIENAPDELEQHPVSDFSDLSRTQCYLLENGETVQTQFRGTTLWFSRIVSGDDEVRILKSYELDELRFDDFDWLADAYAEPTMTREAAEAILWNGLEKMGFSGFTIHAAYPADALLIHMGPGYDDDPTAEFHSSGWSFRLRRNYGDYPGFIQYMSPSELNYPGGAEVFIEPLFDERIDVYIDENGMEYFWYGVKKEVVGIVNPDVDLLSFDELKTRIMNAFAAVLPGSFLTQHSSQFEIYRMVLSTYTVREKDSDTVLEMPCWFIYYDFAIDNVKYREFKRTELTGDFQECLILNAVDGSIIDCAAGY